MQRICLTAERSSNDRVLYPIDKKLVSEYIKNIDKVLEKKYLENPCIRDCVYDIYPTRILIRSPSTTYIERYSIIKFNQKDILASYKLLLSLAREKGVKLRYTCGLKKSILADWGEYEEAVRNYNEIFEELYKRVQLLEVRGIRYCTSKDEYLEICMAISNTMDRYKWGSSIIIDIGSRVEYINSLVCQLRNLGYDSGVTIRV